MLLIFFLFFFFVSCFVFLCINRGELLEGQLIQLKKKIAEEMETVYRENNKDGKGQR